MKELIVALQIVKMGHNNLNILLRYISRGYLGLIF